MNLFEQRAKALGLRLLRKLQYMAFRQRWNIAATPHPASVVAGLEGAASQERAMRDLQWMAEVPEAFAADPFIVRRLGKLNSYQIFYEAYPWAEKRGRIDCVNFENGSFRTSRVSLSSPHHLSYPYTLPYFDDVVIMPEHSSAKDISLFRVNDDGVAVGNEPIGLRLNLIDSSIVHHNGRYWMFATEAGPNENSDLYIYHSTSVRGEWRPHAQNPVKSDRSNARPAGQFIFFDRKIFRPAQDCTTHYGATIKINEINVLNPEKFHETEVSQISPLAGSPYQYGLHTISSTENYTVIDGARIESSIHPLLDGVGNRILAITSSDSIRS